MFLWLCGKSRGLTGGCGVCGGGVQAQEAVGAASLSTEEKIFKVHAQEPHA